MASNRTFKNSCVLVEIFSERDVDPLDALKHLRVVGTTDAGVLSDENGEIIARAVPFTSHDVQAAALPRTMRACDLDPRFFGIDDEGSEVDD